MHAGRFGRSRRVFIKTKPQSGEEEDGGGALGQLCQPLVVIKTNPPPPPCSVMNSSGTWALKWPLDSQYADTFLAGGWSWGAASLQHEHTPRFGRYFTEASCKQTRQRGVSGGGTLLVPGLHPVISS